MNAPYEPKWWWWLPTRDLGRRVPTAGTWNQANLNFIFIYHPSKSRPTHLVHITLNGLPGEL